MEQLLGIMEEFNLEDVIKAAKEMGIFKEMETLEALQTKSPLEEAIDKFCECWKTPRPISPFRPTGESLGPDFEILARLQDAVMAILLEPVPLKPGVYELWHEELAAIQSMYEERMATLNAEYGLKVDVTTEYGEMSFIPILPTPREMRALRLEAIRTTSFLMQASEKDKSLAFEILLIVLIAFGVKEIAEHIFTNPRVAGILAKIGQAHAKKQWDKVSKLLVSLLEVLTSKKFVAYLAKKIGKKAAAKAVAMIASKFVPIIGWVVFAGILLWAIKESWPELSKKF